MKEDFLDKWLEEAINVSLQYQVIELQEASRNHLYQKVTVMGDMKLTFSMISLIVVANSAV